MEASSPVSDGQYLLSKYQKTKSLSKSSSSRNSDYQEKSIMDGSRLMELYSAKKRIDMSSLSSQYTPNNSVRRIFSNRMYQQQLDLLHDVLIKLGKSSQGISDEYDHDNFLVHELPSIMASLQTIEQSLINFSANENDSPTSSIKNQIIDDTIGNVMNNHERSVIKVYMDNQLDLNESELQRYEECLDTVNDKLDSVVTERDNYYQKNQQLINELNAERRRTTDTNASYDQLRNQFELLSSENDDNKKQITSLENRIESFLGIQLEYSNTIRSLEAELLASNEISILNNNLKQNIVSLEAALTQSGNIIVENDDLKRKIWSLEAELLASYEISIVNNNMKQHIVSLEAALAQSNNIIVENDDLKRQLAHMQPFSTEIIQLKAELNVASTTLGVKDEEIHKLHSLRDELLAQNNASMINIENQLDDQSISLFQETIQDRDNTIADLDSKLRVIEETLVVTEAELQRSMSATALISSTGDRDSYNEKMLSQLQNEIHQKNEQILYYNELYNDRIKDKDRIIEELLQSKELTTPSSYGFYNNHDRPNCSIDDLKMRLIDANDQLKEYLLIIANKDEELAMAEDALVEIQKQFEQAKAHMQSNYEKSKLEKSRLRSSNITTPFVTPSANSFYPGLVSVERDNAIFDSIISNSSYHALPQNISMADMNELQSLSIPELISVVTIRDSHMKSLTSQLESMQDSLTEYKNSNNLLKQHKKGLKDLTESLKNKYDAERSEHLATKQALESVQKPLYNYKSPQKYHNMNDIISENNQLKDDINALKSTLSTLRSELDSHIVNISHQSTSSGAAEEEYQTMQDLNRLLELKCNELSEELTRKDVSLQQLSDDNLGLTDFLTKLKTKDESTDALILEHKSIIENVTHEKEVCHEHVMRMEEEISNLRMEFVSLKQSTDDEISNNQSALQKLEKEKNDLVQQLLEFKMNNSKVLLDSNYIHELVHFYNSKQYQQEQDLMNYFNQVYESYMNRLQSVNSIVIKTLSQGGSLHKANELISKSLLECKNSLSLALDRIIKLENENEEQKRALNEHDTQRYYFEQSLHQADKEHDELNQSKVVIQEATEEIAKLQHTLDLTNQRMNEVVATSTKDFSKSSRTIAFLESECTRLHGLVDHYKVTVIKLQGDTKEYNELAILSQSVQKKLTIMEDNEAVYLERIYQFEVELRQREIDMLAMQRDHEVLKESLQDHYQATLSTQNDQISELNHKYNLIYNDLHTVKQQLQDSHSKYDTDTKQLSDTVTANNRYIDDYAQKMKELELILIENTEFVNSQNEQILDYKNQLVNTKSQLSAVLEEHTKFLKQYEEIIDEYKTKMIALQTETVFYRQESNEITNKLNEKDQIITEHIEKQVYLTEEIRKLRSHIDTMNNDIAALSITIEERQAAVNDLQIKYTTSTDEYHQIKANNYQLIIRITEYENNIEDDMEKKRLLENKIRRIEDDNMNLNSTVTDLMNKLYTLEDASSQHRLNEDVMMQSIDGLKIEKDRVSNELNNAFQKIGHLNKNLVEVNGALSDKVKMLEITSKHLGDLENKYKTKLVEIDGMNKALSHMNEANHRNDALQLRVNQCDDELKKFKLHNDEVIIAMNDLVLNIRSSYQHIDTLLIDIASKVNNHYTSDLQLSAPSLTLFMNSVTANQEINRTNVPLYIKALGSCLISGYREMETFSLSLHSFLQTSIRQADDQLKFNQQLQLNEGGLIQELTNLKSRYDMLVEEHGVQKTTIGHYTETMQNLKKENEHLKSLTQDLTHKYAICQEEIKNSLSNNHDLLAALQEAETGYLDLTNRIKLLQVDNESKTNDLLHIYKENDIIKNKGNSYELELEKYKNILSRVQSQFEISETSKNALTVELDKLSKEISRLKLENQNERNQLNQSNYLHDIEKVLQIISSYKFVSSDLDDLEQEYSSQKVTSAINKMNALYNTYKDELRAKKTLESKCKELNQELEQYTSIIETTKRELLDHRNNVSALESDLNSKMKELNQYVHNNKSLQELVNNYRKREDELKSTYETERKARSQQLVDYQLMDNDLTRLRIESDGNRSTINKLQDQVSSYKTKVAEEISTNENYVNQIRLLKSNNTKLTSTLQQMEKGLESDKKEMETLDKKLSDADSNINMINKLKLQIGILENDLLHQKEENKILLANRSDMIRSINDITVEMELLKRKINLNESKIATLQSDNTNLNQELINQKAKFNDSIKAYSATKQISSESGTSTNALAGKIKLLERGIEEKNELLSNEINARMRHEQDITKLKAMIERANRELIVSTEKSTALRNEGRKGRKVVQELISYVKEYTQLTQSGKPPSSVLLNTTQQLKSLIVDSNTDGTNGGTDTLGIAELTNLILLLRVTTSKLVTNVETVKEITINTKPVTDLALEELYKLQEQKIQLEHSLNSTRNDCERMGIEISKLKITTNDYMKSLNKEKQEKDLIKSELDLLRVKYDELLSERTSKENYHAVAIDSTNIKLSTSSSADTVHAASTATYDEITQLKTRSSVLCDTIEKLENKLLLKYDPPKDTTSFPDEVSHNRLRAKISAMEDLINTYRNSILSLSRNIATKRDHMSIFTSDTTDFVDSDQVDLDGGYIIEHEIASMKRSYQDEVSLLEDEISNLKTKLNANNNYVNELRSRFEENIKQLYVPGKNMVIDTLTKELSDLNIALESTDKTIQQLHNQIALEREAARRKHDSYMDHLFKVINTRDSAINTIKQLEKLMHQSGMEHKAEYIALHHEFTNVLKASSRMRNEYNEQKRAIDGLMKGLIEHDHELHEAERRASRQQNKQQITRRSFTGTGAILHSDHERVTSEKDKKYSSSPFVVRSAHNFPKK